MSVVSPLRPDRPVPGRRRRGTGRISADGGSSLADDPPVAGRRMRFFLRITGTVRVLDDEEISGDPRTATSGGSSGRRQRVARCAKAEVLEGPADLDMFVAVPGGSRRRPSDARRTGTASRSLRILGGARDPFESLLTMATVVPGADLALEPPPPSIIATPTAVWRWCAAGCGQALQPAPGRSPGPVARRRRPAA